MNFIPKFTTTHIITAALVKIERARGFLEAARLSDEWIAKMQAKTLILEAHYTTHIARGQSCKHAKLFSFACLQA